MICSGMMTRAPALIIGLFLLQSACTNGWLPGNSKEVCDPYPLGLPATYAPPSIREENCLTTAKVELGRRLFYEKRLSKNETQSCSSCHIQRYAFSDHKTRALGSTGQVHPRNAPALTNVAYFRTLTWAAPRLNRLENQAINPLFSADGPESIIELGVARMEDVVASRLRPDYAPLFQAAFGEGSIDIPHIALALEAFETTLLSYESAYDRGAMNEAARRGELIFRSAGCAGCHSGVNFNETEGVGTVDSLFHNVGLYNVAGLGDYPDHTIHGAPASKRTQGLYAITKNSSDRGRFRTPSLRNVALTAPYMHDGSVDSLEQVIEIFNAGGRNVVAGPFKGDGRRNANRDPRVHSLGLTGAQKSDLLEFLRALTDECFVRNPLLSDPAHSVAEPAPGYCSEKRRP